MSIASLSKFTVPLGSSQAAATEGMLMPKLKYRFRISLENFGASGSSGELTKQVAEAARPTLTFDDKTIDLYNSTIHYAGKPKWGTMVVKLRDDVTGEVTKLVGQQMQKQFDFFEQSSAASGGDYKFTMRIEMLDGGNGNGFTVLEEWECVGCYVTSAAYNQLAYNSSDAITIDLTIQPDNCIQLNPTTALGNQGTTRTVGTNATGGGSFNG